MMDTPIRQGVPQLQDNRPIGLHRRIFYGWWICLTGAVTMSMAGGLFFLGYGFFFEPMRLHFNWSRTLLSGAFALTRVESGFFGPLEGYLIQRFGPRNVMTISFVFFGMGFVMLSFVTSPITFYLVFIVLAAGAGTAGFSGVMAALANWFRRMRSRAIGISFLGMGLGGVIFPPLLALGIDNLGWQDTAVYCGIFIMVVGIPLSRVVRFKPEPYGYLPDGDKPEPPPPETETTAEPATPQQTSPEFEYTAREALKTWPFWLISIGHGLSLMVISVISIHQVPYLEDELGFTRASAAMVVMVMTGVSMLGQLIGGYIGDRYSKKYIAAATLAGHVVALGLLGIADALPLVLVAAVIQGTAWGFRTPVLIAMRGDYFGRESFAMIMGFSQAIMMIGMIVGPLLSGYFADNYSYSTGFKLCAVLVIPGIFMFLFLRKPKPKPVRD